jgi:hypothetical protein
MVKYGGRKFVEILGVSGKIILNGPYRHGIRLVQPAVSVGPFLVKTAKNINYCFIYLFK